MYKNWYVVITEENKEVIKDWFISQGCSKYKAYSTNAGYGFDGFGNIESRAYHKDCSGKLISYDEFLQIINGQLIYEIY